MILGEICGEKLSSWRLDNINWPINRLGAATYFQHFSRSQGFKTFKIYFFVVKKETFHFKKF